MQCTVNNGQCRDFKRKDILLQRYSDTVLFNPYQNTYSNLQAFLLIKNLRIRYFVDCTLRMDTQNVNCSAVALQRIKHPIRGQVSALLAAQRLCATLCMVGRLGVGWLRLHMHKDVKWDLNFGFLRQKRLLSPAKSVKC